MGGWKEGLQRRIQKQTDTHCSTKALSSRFPSEASLPYATLAPPPFSIATTTREGEGEGGGRKMDRSPILIAYDTKKAFSSVRSIFNSIYN